MSLEASVLIHSGSDAETASETEILKALLEGVTDVRGVPHDSAQSGLEVLAVVLSSVVLQELAKGLANLFQRDRGATVEVTFSDGEYIKVSGVSQKSAVEIYAELSEGMGIAK